MSETSPVSRRNALAGAWSVPIVAAAAALPAAAASPTRPRVSTQSRCAGTTQGQVFYTLTGGPLPAGTVLEFEGDPSISYYAVADRSGASAFSGFRSGNSSWRIPDGVTAYDVLIIYEIPAPGSGRLVSRLVAPAGYAFDPATPTVSFPRTCIEPAGSV
ncbi:hypothetical protein [Pseudoclavibacter helvolus]|uniref:hypothetical protein n=1 Tax=Pseudoclavibacter helvolus TaxID=255205 RepID=UPI003C708138